MRSEKDQMTAGKEKSAVEIQFSDASREQENLPGNLKQKEEKKEVFTKVGVVYTLRGHADMEGKARSVQHRGQRPGGGRKRDLSANTCSLPPPHKSVNLYNVLHCI